MLLSRHSDLFRGKDLLEIGSGTGIQLAALSRVCRRAVGVDYEQGEYTRHRITNVMNYDGVHLPFEAGTYDIVYSSNVLEHVVRLAELLDECRRVLRPDGYAAHIVPTHLWKYWSVVTHFASVPFMVTEQMRERINRNRNRNRASGARAAGGAGDGSGAKSGEGKRLLRLPSRVALSRLGFPPRHGERGSRFTEAWYFRPKWWRAEFERLGWRVVLEEAAGLFYTSNALLGPLLGWRSRSVLAHIGGSACRLFVIVPHR